MFTNLSPGFFPLTQSLFTGAARLSAVGTKGLAVVGIALAAATFVVPGGTSPAHAATCDTYVNTSFSVDTDGSVGGCYVGPSGGNDSEGALETELLFGVNDWTFISKDDADDGLDGVDEGTLGTFAVVGGTKATDENPNTDTSLWSVDGTWSIDNALVAAFSKVAIVFKDGNGAVPDSWVAFLVNLSSGDETTGTYRTPFLNVKNDGTFAAKDISHISLYGAVTPIPLPAALPLFGAALGGLGLLGWRRKRRVAATA